MKSVRREILKLVQIYIEKESDFSFFNQQFLPSLQVMVQDYQQSIPETRDPEVLLLFATILKKQGDFMSQFLENILQGLCQPTLDVIMHNFYDYPDFREPFFKLVHNIVNHCTSGML